MMEELYRDEILDHYNNPRNFGNLPHADVSFHDYNQVCGDDVNFQLIFEKGKVKKAMFRGKGCAISQAAASMLTELVEGKSIQQIKKLGNDDLLGIMKIKPGPVRMKCALLPLKALQKGMIIYDGEKNGKAIDKKPARRN
jgi:nitrogen fixation protein NifU and related proteins